jgi:RNA polymerase sigma factor (sigma-70 family)
MSGIDADPVRDPARSTGCPTSDADEQCEVLEALTLLAALPERKRSFLTLKVAGFSYDEIAAELNVSWLTVNRQLVRARAALRDARARDQGPGRRGSW